MKVRLKQMLFCICINLTFFLYYNQDCLYFDSVRLWQIRRMIIKEMMILNGCDVRIGVSLLVGDMDGMVRFYRDTLG
ncbi:MAG: hypothetical protein RR352_07880, partial [Clostridia bacterium]